MASEERIAVLEERLTRLAEEQGIIRRRQDDFQTWIHEHEKKELSHHNEVMTAMSTMSNSLLAIKENADKAEKAANSASVKRRDWFDRILRVALAAVVLIGALNELYKYILSKGVGP